MASRTITLTGRPPVRIEDDNWPILAEASDAEHDGQVECQANRKSSWWVRVRQHADGRSIVYAGYYYSSNWQGERRYSPKRGMLLAAGADVPAAIQQVCEDIAAAEHYGDDADRWPTLAAACIAEMPAEELT